MEEEKIIDCWACKGKGLKIEEWKYTARTLGENDVEIKITHCGICGSDIHQMDSGWGEAIYPIVPGHEIVGHIVNIGSQVTDFKLGDRVGVGPQCWSCGTCKWCEKGKEILCEDGVFTYNSAFMDGSIAYGGYAKYIRADSRFVFQIPENLSSEGVAPLLCAGITTFLPLIRNGLGKGHKVGILGVGGLGHMAIKWANAFGCEVTAISHSPEKEADSKNLGAHKFLNTNDRKETNKFANYFDAIITTISVSVKWGNYFRLIKPEGKLLFVGVPEEEISLKAQDIIFKNITISGSLVGNPSDFKQMLKFASEHNILSDVQVWPVEKINEALEQFREGKPRYRFVLAINQ